MKTADKQVYTCPVCGYTTHFQKALDAHMKFRKHEAPKEPEIKEPAPVAEVQAAQPEKTVRKPRRKKTTEAKE